MIAFNKNTTTRYATVSKEKADGATYTPKILADFVALKIVEILSEFSTDRPIRILDPAVGDGELLISLLEKIFDSSDRCIKVYGFETNHIALNKASARISQKFPSVELNHSGLKVQRIVWTESPGCRLKSRIITRRQSRHRYDSSGDGGF